MIGELCVRDDAFAALWASARVSECVAGTKHMTHPRSGDITVNFQLWAQPDRPDQRIEIYELLDDPDMSRTNALLDAPRSLHILSPGPRTICRRSGDNPTKDLLLRHPPDAGCAPTSHRKTSPDPGTSYRGGRSPVSGLRIWLGSIPGSFHAIRSS
ncbi:hypothetical protein ACVWXU_001455 [Streptomyces sp. TE33382]